VIYKVQVEFSKEFFEIKENQIRIGIKSNPVKGEANKELIKKNFKTFQNINKFGSDKIRT
jgi:uncharacterized protein YggU (UPF0235/DUF167 family)